MNSSSSKEPVTHNLNFMDHAPASYHPNPLISSDLLAYYRWVSTQSLTVTDVETTGHLAAQNRVTEIAVVQASLQQGIQHCETTLMNGGVRVPLKITEITGISQAMVGAAPLSETIWPTYLPLLQQGILTAHNLAFDYGFLQAEYRRMGIKFERSTTEQLCTVILSRLMLPELPSRSLPNLVKHFGFQVGRSHRAEADAIACWLLVERLLTDLNHCSDADLLKRFAKQWLDLKDAAAILRCRPKQAGLWLEQAGMVGRSVGAAGTRLYRRGDVETVFHQQRSLS